MSPDGTYTSALSVDYGNGTPTSVESAPFILDVTPPTGSVALSEALFSPEETSKTIGLTVDASSPVAKIESWTMKIISPEGMVFRTFTGTWPQNQATWDGTSSTGAFVESAEDYPVQVNVTDAFGNVGTLKGKVPVDILVFDTPEGYRIQASRIFFKPFTADYLDVAADIARQNTQRLDSLAAKLKKFPGDKIRVVGHAVMIYWNNPTLGKLEQQDILIPLSLARAKAIEQALSDRGVHPKEFIADGVGASDQIVPGQRPQGSLGEPQGSPVHREVGGDPPPVVGSCPVSKARGLGSLSPARGPRLLELHPELQHEQAQSVACGVRPVQAVLHVCQEGSPPGHFDKHARADGGDQSRSRGADSRLPDLVIGSAVEVGEHSGSGKRCQPFHEVRRGDCEQVGAQLQVVDRLQVRAVSALVHAAHLAAETPVLNTSSEILADVERNSSPIQADCVVGGKILSKVHAEDVQFALGGSVEYGDEPGEAGVEPDEVGRALDRIEEPGRAPLGAHLCRGASPHAMPVREHVIVAEAGLQRVQE